MNYVLSLDSLPPPPPGAAPSRQLWDLVSLGQSSRREQGTSPSRGGIISWSQGSGGGRVWGSLRRVGSVCMWGWNVCAESSQVAALPCEILIIPASAISARHSGPPLLNISLTPLTSHCSSPTLLPPTDPSPTSSRSSRLHPHPGHPRAGTSPALPWPRSPRWGESRGAVLRQGDHPLPREHNGSAPQQVLC